MAFGSASFGSGALGGEVVPTAPPVILDYGFGFGCGFGSASFGGLVELAQAEEELEATYQMLEMRAGVSETRVEVLS